MSKGRPGQAVEHQRRDVDDREDKQKGEFLVNGESHGIEMA